MRKLALVPIPVLIAMPLCINTSWAVGLAAMVSGAACLLAVVRTSLQYATAGGVLALVSMALALRDSSSSSLHVLMAGIFGLALLLLIDATHLSGRFDGAAITRTWWRRHIVWWSARAAISLATVIVIAILAPLVAVTVPHLWGPFLAGLGVLSIIAAALAFAWPRVDE